MAMLPIWLCRVAHWAAVDGRPQHWT